MVLKLTVFLFVFAILYLIREIFMFVKAIVRGMKNITTWRLVGIGVALAFVITIIATGFVW